MPIINVKLIEDVFTPRPEARDRRAPHRRDGLDRRREHAPGDLGRRRGGRQRRHGRRRQAAEHRIRQGPCGRRARLAFRRRITAAAIALNRRRVGRRTPRVVARHRRRRAPPAGGIENYGHGHGDLLPIAQRPVTAALPTPARRPQLAAQMERPLRPGKAQADGRRADARGSSTAVARGDCRDSGPFRAKQLSGLASARLRLFVQTKRRNLT